MWFSSASALLAIPSIALALVLEAEDGLLNGVAVATDTPGYSGTGYVQGFDASTDSVTVNFHSDTQALYDVVVTYGSPYGEKHTNLMLNGAGAGEVVFADTSTTATPWANASAGQILFNAGDNTLSFVSDW